MKKNCDLGLYLPRWLKKILLVMRITGILCLVCVMHLSAAVYSQTARINLKMKDATIEQVLNRIAESTKMDFFYSNSKIDVSKKVNVDFFDATLEEALRTIFKGSDVKFEIADNFVVIHYVRALVAADTLKKISVAGTVKDSKGGVLPGVTIQVKGTTIGFTTDIDGKFHFELPKRDSLVLVFSYVGFQKQEVCLKKDNKSLHVVMKNDLTEIDEVVVTGYQAVRKKAMAGSVYNLSASDLVMNGVSTVEQMLQGQIPGVMIMNTSGLTGTRQKVRVRGTSTLIGNAEPVWVVDGIIQQDPLPFKVNELADISDDNIDMIKNFVGGAIAWLNPQDIADITVLKDASATAIYGVKAANGVIVITTKKGERGRLSLSYSGNFTMGERLNYNRMELMNSQERVALSREAYERGAKVRNESIGYTGLALAFQRREISLDEFNREAKKMETENTDWFDILYQTPFSQSHTVSVSGGDEHSSYYASLGYSSNENTAKGNEQTSYTARLNINSTFWNKLNISVSLAGSHTETDAFATGVEPFNYAIKTSRVIPCFDEDGGLFFYKDKNSGYNYNILNELQYSGNWNKGRNLNLSLSARWTLSDAFVLSTTLGGASSSNLGRIWFSERTHYITKIRKYEYGSATPEDERFKNSCLPYGGMLTVNENENFNYTWRNQVEFIKNLGAHSINLMGGFEIACNKNEGYSHTAYGYMPDRGETFIDVPLMIKQYGEMRANQDYANLKPVIVNSLANTVSYYLSGVYMYDSRYAFNFSVRSDGSNRFGQDSNQKFQPVWSLGGRWNVTSEPWLQNQNVLNDLSFSATFGYQGNVVDAISPNLIAKMLPLDDLTGEFKMTYTKLPTPDVRWEKTRSVNLGMTWGLLGNKINGSFEYYHKKTTDLITNREVPYENGVKTMYVNGGDMSNSGWDLVVNFVPVRTKDFVWNLSFNTSKVSNKLDSSLEPTGDWSRVVNGEFHKKGYPVSSFWAFRFKGLDPNNGGPLFDLSRANTNSAELDVTEYMVHAGKLDPDLTAGLNMNFRYKNWTLATSFYLSLGNQCFLDSPYGTGYNATSMLSEYENASSQLLKRWMKPGDEKHTKIPSIPVGENSRSLYPFKNNYVSLYPYEAWGYSDARVVDAWYLRCNSINLSYVFPEKLVKKFAQSMSVSFMVTNPFQIVSKDFDGRDSEVAKGNQPLSSNYTLNFHVSF